MTTYHQPAHRADPQSLQEDIARQRQAIAETVSDLQARLDVKSRAQHKMHDLREKATDDAGHPKPEVKAAAAVGGGVVAGLLVRRVRRARNHE